MLKRLRRRLRTLLIRGLLWCVQVLSIDAAARLGSALGRLAYHLARGERRKALDSLGRAFPDKSQAEREALAQACFRHLGGMAGELAVVSKLDAARHQRIEWPAEDRARMDAALARGRGVVFVTGHLGSWEVLARHVALEGYRAAVIGKETSDPGTTALLESLRARAGLRVLWRGSEGAAKEMLRALRSNSILGLLIDQDTRVQSVWVPFFGHLAKTPRAAADLALRTGAVPMLGFGVRLGPGRYRLSMREVPLPTSEGEAAVAELTATLTRGIEDAIRAQPEQWVWMHQRWKSPPPGQTSP